MLGLNAQARAASYVWNYCNETQRKAAQSGRKWLTGFDLWKLVAGATKEGLDLRVRITQQAETIDKKSSFPEQTHGMLTRGTRAGAPGSTVVAVVKIAAEIFPS